MRAGPAAPAPGRLMRRTGSYGASLNRGRDGKKPAPPWPEGKTCGAGCSCMLVILILRLALGPDFYNQLQTLDVVGSEAHDEASLATCVGLAGLRLRRDGDAARLPRREGCLKLDQDLCAKHPEQGRGARSPPFAAAHVA